MLVVAVEGHHRSKNQGFMLRRVPVSETPDHLVQVINQHFLADPQMRPHERLKVSFKLDTIRDWKSWLAASGKRITGLLGPAAPHVLEFVRRDSYLPSTATFMKPLWHVGKQGQKTDRRFHKYTDSTNNSI